MIVEEFETKHEFYYHYDCIDEFDKWKTTHKVPLLLLLFLTIPGESRRKHQEGV